MKRSSSFNKLPIKIMVLFLIWGGGFVYYWFWHTRATQLVEDVLAHQARMKDYYTLSYEDLKFKGFPFSLKVVLKNPTFTKPLKEKSQEIHGKVRGSLIIESSVWSPGYVHFQSDGKTEITSALFLRRVSPAFKSLEIGKFQGSINLFDQEKSTDVRLEEVCFLIGEKEVGSIGLIKSSFQRDFPEEDKLNRERFSLILDLENIRSKDQQHLDQVHLATNLMGALPLKPSFKESAQKWFEAGGTLELNDLIIREKNDYLKLNGTLSLDEQLQPLGAFMFEVKGGSHVLKSLFPSSEIWTYLSLLPKEKDSKGEPKPLQLSLTLQDQELSLGFFKIPVSKVDWKVLDKFYKDLTQAL